MIDGSEKRNRQLAFELQNSHVCEKRSKCALGVKQPVINKNIDTELNWKILKSVMIGYYQTVFSFPSRLTDYITMLSEVSVFG